MPDFIAYHQSLNNELTAIKDRVRNLINHYPTDGAFKESALRYVLRRHLPESLFIGTGFIVTNTDCSNQIDVLIVDKNHPRLFWDGDLVIVTPEAVRAAIEVKTGLNRPAEIEEAILKAAENKAKWHRALYGWKNFLGLFVYEERGNHEEAILTSIESAKKRYRTTVDCVAYGNDVFVDAPGQIVHRRFQGWVSRRTEGMAAACFLGKLIGYFSESSLSSTGAAWQPLMKKDSILKYLPFEGSTIEEVPLEDCLRPSVNADDQPQQS